MARRNRAARQAQKQRQAEAVAHAPRESPDISTDPQGEERVVSRYIPADVRRHLRQEVGFGCPVPNCGNPYLTYHHFDPPYAVDPHNEPEGMIALCWMHHQQERAWAVEDFRKMKRAGAQREEIRGRFEWLKHDVLTIAGGNFYYQNGVEIAHHQAGNVLWYTRDEENRMLLNLRMLHTAQSAGTVMLDENDWTVYGNPVDLESPPRGSYLRVEFPSGDRLSVDFRQHDDPLRLCREYDRTEAEMRSMFSFPLITAEITMAVGGTGINFGPRETKVGGMSMVGCTITHCGTGLVI